MENGPEDNRPAGPARRAPPAVHGNPYGPQGHCTSRGLCRTQVSLLTEMVGNFDEKSLACWATLMATVRATFL